jgi:Tfp pilus assembly protein PilZ
MTEDDKRSRRHPRRPVEVPVRVSTLDPETDPRTGRAFFRTTQETCANLSRGGAFIRTHDALSPGRRVLLEIDLPERGPIEAIGRIAWSKTVLGAVGPDTQEDETGVGVEFLGGSREALSALETYLEHEAAPKRRS